MDVLPTCFEFLPLPDGGVLRFALWSPDTAQPRATILLLGGRTEFIEKYWETIGELTQRGFMVCSFDWRGQGLSSRLLADHRKGHIASFDTYLEDLALIVTHVVKPRMQPPLIVLAHSMGGHLALRFILDSPDVFDHLVLTAPMVDVHMAPAVKRCLHCFADFIVQRGGSDWYVLGARINARRAQRFKGNQVTSDRRRFERTQHLIASQPALAVGGVTYAWLKAAFGSIDALRNKVRLNPIDVPTLLVSAGEDKIVSNQAQQALGLVLPRCRHLTIPRARHEILMESAHYRSQFWAAFDAIKLDV